MCGKTAEEERQGIDLFPECRDTLCSDEIDIKVLSPKTRRQPHTETDGGVYMIIITVYTCESGEILDFSQNNLRSHLSSFSSRRRRQRKLYDWRDGEKKKRRTTSARRVKTPVLRLFRLCRDLVRYYDGYRTSAVPTPLGLCDAVSGRETQNFRVSTHHESHSDDIF